MSIKVEVKNVNKSRGVEPWLVVYDSARKEVNLGARHTFADNKEQTVYVATGKRSEDTDRAASQVVLGYSDKAGGRVGNEGLRTRVKVVETDKVRVTFRPLSPKAKA